MSIICGKPFPPIKTLITSNPSTTVRNDFSGSIGARFTVGSGAIYLTQLGRWKLSGNTQTRVISIWNDAGTKLFSTSINLNGLPIGYNYVDINPFLLSANTTYRISTYEILGSDTWYEGAVYTVDPAITINAAVFGVGDVFPANGAVTGGMYAALNFKFHSA